MIPGKKDFTASEWKLIQRLNTPAKVQRYFSTLAYNREVNGGTLRSFRELIKRKEVHCLEAAVGAAVILEQHGYPPLLLDLESQDLLDHVIFVFKEERTLGVGCAFPGHRLAWSKAGLSLAQRSGVELFRSICRLHRPVKRLRPRESL